MPRYLSCGVLTVGGREQFRQVPLNGGDVHRHTAHSPPSPRTSVTRRNTGVSSFLSSCPLHSPSPSLHSPSPPLHSLSTPLRSPSTPLRSPSPPLRSPSPPLHSPSPPLRSPSSPLGFPDTGSLSRYDPGLGLRGERTRNNVFWSHKVSPPLHNCRVVGVTSERETP